MIDALRGALHAHREPAYLLFHHLVRQERDALLWSDLRRELEAFTDTEQGEALRGTAVEDALCRTQEAHFTPSWAYLAVREEVARWRYVQIHLQELHLREIEVSEFLRVKEASVRRAGEDGYTLEVDLAPFERGFPRVDDAEDIGYGVDFLNRHLCDRLRKLGSGAPDRVFDFLKVHQVEGRPLMLGSIIRDGAELREALADADAVLEEATDDDEEWRRELARLGFEPGWGDTRERVRETMGFLARVLEDPEPETLAKFLARIPMIFSVAILSPHGYFGQADVLGKPDTGGQVVYILDQVRALERAMRASIRSQGLDVEPDIVVLTRLIPEAGETSCNQRVEPILGTTNARILRVPFRHEGAEVPQWISRFEIWPYLEGFAADGEKELLAEMGGRPDIVIGNYSDGNLVAAILAERLGVTQCNIAHALEKTKYLHSDLHWKEMEDDFHFSCQFTADLIAMNTADFVITSTYQEIAGTEETVGQYESYGSFTLPGLYRVVSGIDCFDPKFNILSPGADVDTFFPYSARERRPDELVDEIRELVYGEPGPGSRGRLERDDRPLLFAMSRLDRVKNMPGFLEWYADSPELREVADVLLVGGTLDPDACRDPDERDQVEKMHALLDRPGLESQVRWLEMQTDKNRVGALYRLVADTRGAFVQPALFEAFGLTVVEAMSSGLPVCATRFGGPLEIVEDGVSGFHIDPSDGAEAARIIADFIHASTEDPAVWKRVSEGALARVRDRYTWERYADEFLRLSRIYGFWRHISSLEREETRRYLEMFYGLMYRKRAATVAHG